MYKVAQPVDFWVQLIMKIFSWHRYYFLKDSYTPLTNPVPLLNTLITGYTILYFYYNYRLVYMHFQVDNLMKQITVEIGSIYFIRVILQIFSRLFHYNRNFRSTTTIYIKVSQLSLISLNVKEGGHFNIITNV